MRILVLGGRGFLGSHVVDKFLAEKHDVSVFDLSSDRFRRTPPDVHVFHGDFGNVGVLDDVISTGFDAVLHFIGTTTPKSSVDSPEFDIQSNVIGTIRLLDVCVRHKVRKFIFPSSGGSVYGDIGSDAAVDELHPVRPICSYAISKLTIENFQHQYRHAHGLDYVALRIANPYGERQSPHLGLGAFTVFLHRMIKNQTIEVWGDGSVERDFIYAGDVANAVYAATIKPLNGVFNVGSGVGVSLRDLIGEISVALGVEPAVAWVKGRSFDVPRIVLDSSKLQKAADWKCRTSLRDGIAITAEWLRHTENL